MPADEVDGPRYLQPYRDALERHGPSFEALLWNNPAWQRRRFEVLLESVDVAGRIVLDAGAGRGDLLALMRERDVQYGRYLGMEASPELAAEGAALGADEAEFYSADFVADDDAFTRRGSPEVILFSGSLNTLEQDQALAVLEKAWDAAGEAIAFNFLSQRACGRFESQPIGPSHRFDPGALLEWAFARTSAVALRTEYLEGHDATMALWKAPPPPPGA